MDDAAAVAGGQCNHQVEIELDDLRHVAEQLHVDPAEAERDEPAERPALTRGGPPVQCAIDFTAPTGAAP